MSKLSKIGNMGKREVVSGILGSLVELDREYRKSASRFVKFGARERTIINRELGEVKKEKLSELYRLFISVMFMRVCPMIIDGKRKGGSEEYRNRLESILKEALRSYISIASTNLEILEELRDFALKKEEIKLEDNKLILYLGAIIAETIEVVRVKTKIKDKDLN